MDYIIQRKNIKNFIIRIYPDLTIKISVPLKARDEDIEKFIRNKKEWIEKSLKKFRDNKTNLDENTIYFLGEKKKKKYIISEINKIKIKNETLLIYYDKEKNSEKIFEDFKLEILNKILSKYLNKYCEILNVKINSYKLKKMKSAWGIYYLKNNSITFNTLLIEKEEKSIEYVVLHELCHIFYQNHQKEFWNLVAKHMPDYKEKRKKLKS